MQSQVKFKGVRRRLQRRSQRRFWESLVQGQVSFQQVQQGFQHLALQHASERFVKIKRCGFWGCHRSLFFFLSFLMCCLISSVKTKCFFSDVFCRFSSHNIHRINKIPDGSASGSAGDWWPSLYFCCTMWLPQELLVAARPESGSHIQWFVLIFPILHGNLVVYPTFKHTRVLDGARILDGDTMKTIYSI